MPLGKATIDYDGYELLVKFEPYRFDIVEEIKAAIPPGFRGWDAVERVWRVSKQYREAVEDIFDSCEYAIRDYTGDDITSRVRQDGYKAARERKRAEELKRDAEKVKKEEAARRTKEERERRAAEAQGKEPPKATYDAPEQESVEFIAYLMKLKLQKRFFVVWPQATERDFNMWFSLFLVSGRDYANRKFSQMWWERHGGVKKPSQNTQQTLVPKDVLMIMNTWKTCSLDEAKGSYRALAMRYHPDRNKEPSALTIMQKINETHDTLWEARGWK